MTLEHVSGALGAAARKTALVATVDPSLAAICEAVLQGAGYQVCRCASVAAATAELAAGPVYLGLVDADLPNDDGIVIGQILWQEHCVPYAVLAAPGDRESAHRAIAGGATQCLLKPVSAAQLLVAIELAAVHGREFGKLRRAIDRRSLDFEQRNIVSMAIGMSMERFGVDENEALHMIRFAARARDEVLPEFCERLIESKVELGLRRDLGTWAKQSG